jgi:hypothetical protein
LISYSVGFSLRERIEMPDIKIGHSEDAQLLDTQIQNLISGKESGLIITVLARCLVEVAIETNRLEDVDTAIAGYKKMLRQ